MHLVRKVIDYVNWHGLVQNRVRCQTSFFAITTRKKKQKKLILVKKRCANLMGTTGSAKQPSCQSCYYSLMFSKYIVCLWFTQYTVPAQVTP